MATPVKRLFLWVYFLLGVFLGTLFSKSEVASWFRIQEMFQFAAFHMYGVIGSAVAVGAVAGAWAYGLTKPSLPH